MANEGSTKPTYSEPPCMDASYRIGYADGLKKNEAELARVRRLLQRLEWSSADGDGYAMCPVCEADGPVANCPADPHEADCWLAAEISGTPANEAYSTFPQSSSLVSQGAESADIGKLDTADGDALHDAGFQFAAHSLRDITNRQAPVQFVDESGVEMGKVNRVEESILKFASLVDAFLCKHFGEYDRGEHPDADELFDLCADLSGVAARKLDAGSAETGGEKAALCPIDFDNKRLEVFKEGIIQAFCECAPLRGYSCSLHKRLADFEKYVRENEQLKLAGSREPEKLNDAQLDTRRVIPAELRRYSWAELQAMENGPNKRFVCEECDGCQIVSSGPHHFVCHICWLLSELDKYENPVALAESSLSSPPHRLDDDDK